MVKRERVILLAQSHSEDEPSRSRRPCLSCGPAKEKKHERQREGVHRVSTCREQTECGMGEKSFGDETLHLNIKCGALRASFAPAGETKGSGVGGVWDGWQGQVASCVMAKSKKDSDTRRILEWTRGDVGGRKAGRTRGRLQSQSHRACRASAC